MRYNTAGGSYFINNIAGGAKIENLSISGNGYFINNNMGEISNIKSWVNEHSFITNNYGDINYFAAYNNQQVVDANYGIISNSVSVSNMTLINSNAIINSSSYNGNITYSGNFGPIINCSTYNHYDDQALDHYAKNGYFDAPRTIPPKDSYFTGEVKYREFLSVSYETTLRELGINTNQYIVIDNARHSTFNPDSTIYDFCEWIQNNGFSIGLNTDYDKTPSISIQMPNHSYMSSELAATFNLIDKTSPYGFNATYLSGTTKLKDIGVNTPAIYTNNGNIFLDPNDTFDDLIRELGNKGISSYINSDSYYFVINGDTTDYIDNMSYNLRKQLGITESYLYNYSYSNSYSYTATPSYELHATSYVNITGSTKLTDIGCEYDQIIETSNGNVNISYESTLADVISALTSKGIQADISGGKFHIRPNNNAYIISMSYAYPGTEEQNLSHTLKLGTFSGEKEFSDDLRDASNGRMVTISSGIRTEDSTLTFDTSFDLTGLMNILIGGIDYNGALDDIDNVLQSISEKEMLYGTWINRLESVMDSLIIQQTSTTSSLSTIRDADIATVSSEYIKAQILSNAAATLLSAANQQPSIALSLI